MAEILLCPNCRAIIPQDGRAPQPRTPETPGQLIARLLAEPPSPPGEYRFHGWTCRYDYGRVFHLLGTVPDVVLAKVISCNRRKLTRLRRRMGMGPAREYAFGLADTMLGKMPDRAVAERVGLNPDTIFQRRRRLGIPPYRGSEYHKRDRGEGLLRDFADRLERSRG